MTTTQPTPTPAPEQAAEPARYGYGYLFERDMKRAGFATCQARVLAQRRQQADGAAPEAPSA